MKYIFNLQLFAELNTNVTTDSGMTAEMRKYYDMALIDEASANLIHDQFGQKRPIPQGNGKTINFRKFESLEKATTPITEGVTPNGKKLEVTDLEATVDQYGDFVTLSDVLEMTAIDNVILEATKVIGRQAGLTLDTITRNKINAGTNVSYCPKLGADGAETAVTTRAGLDSSCALTVKAIQKAVAKLRAQNAPAINGKYVGIIHPYAAYSLMRDKDWVDAHKYANPTNLYEGEIGEIAGVRFVQSSEAKIWTEGSNAVFSTLIVGADAYGTTEITGGGLQTVIKQKGSAGTADPLDQRSSVGWKATKTAEILMENYMVRIESCVADFNTTPAN
jgi:N4-gp56 family major capsid protein